MGGQRFEQEIPHDLDVSGQYCGDPVAARVGDADEGGALVVGTGLAGDHPGPLQQSRLMGQSAAAVDHAVGQIGHRERPPGIDELGQDLELHVAETAFGPELLLHRVLEHADRLGQGEVGTQLSGFEGVGHLSSVLLRIRTA